MSNLLVKKITCCIICGSEERTKYLSLGEQAFANAYLRKEDLVKPESKLPLEVFWCHNCYLAYLGDSIDRSFLFEDYAYFSSTSPQLFEHFANYAEELAERFPEQMKQLTLEIASNDGILLKPCKERGARVLGVDPAKNIARVANSEGIETIADFFGSAIVPDILSRYGKAGIITANNVLAHNSVIHDIISGVKQLLDREGVFVFEVQYLMDLLMHNEFDNTYHEHISYFSLLPLKFLLKKYDMEIFDVKHVDTQGGSLRVFAGHTPLHFPVQASVGEFLSREHTNGLDRPETFKEFAKRPPMVREKLTKLLLELKEQGKKIAGYGAAAKGNTLLQYCNIGPNIINYITDNAPSKQGKYTPGMHIPIVATEHLHEECPDYVLILAWNYASSIIKKEQWFCKQGGKFIVPIPEPQIL